MARLVCLLALAALALDSPGLVRVREQGQASLWVDRPAAEPLTVKLSEKMTIVMRVTGLPSLEVELEDNPRPNAGWSLETVGKPKTTPLDGGKQILWERSFQAWPLKPGPHPLKLPGLKFTENDGPEQAVAWKPLEVQITTRVAKVDVAELRERSEIEDLPDPPEEPDPWWPWLLALGPVAALAWAIVYAYWRRRLPAFSPREAVLRALDDLERQLPAGPDQLPSWHARLADVLRQYLEQQFDWPATRRTTMEFLATPGLALTGDQARQLGDMLRLCDLAKFAGATSGLEQAARALALAREFVGLTKQ